MLSNIVVIIQAKNNIIQQ